MYLSDIYTIAINLAGVPAMSIPAGFITGMPVGLQIIGNYFAEDRLLNIAHQYQQVTDWHQQLLAPKKTDQRLVKVSPVVCRSSFSFHRQTAKSVGSCLAQ